MAPKKSGEFDEVEVPVLVCDQARGSNGYTVLKPWGPSFERKTDRADPRTHSTSVSDAVGRPSSRGHGEHLPRL